MISTFKAILILLMLAGWVLASAAVYVVRVPDEWIGFGVVPKNRLGFTDTYVDVRAWTASDVPAHVDLVNRLIATEKTHWLKHVAPADELPELIEKGISAPAEAAKPAREVPSAPPARSSGGR